jgi:hypothetical protein
MKKITGMTVLLAAALMLYFGSLTANAQVKKIGMAKARAIALKRAAGKIQSAELEREKGKLVYSFDIRTRRGTIREVWVDAYTGRILSVKTESASEEAAEKRLENRIKSRKN